MAIAKDKYRLVFGHRRLAAHLVAQLATISSLVYPPLTAEQVRSIKAAENLQRADLNPIEEAIAVCQILESCGPESMVWEERVAKTAGFLGKSESWVRDRAYIARLTGRARDLVISGRLPIAHAREIAKIGDPDQRDEVARTAARREDGTGGVELRWLKQRVEEYQCSLSIVPWKLDVPFAGKPACSQCPHNSMNDSGLFEHDQAPEKAHCLNAKCFEHKKDAAEKVIAVTIKGVAAKAKPKGKKKSDFAITESNLAEHMPREIKPSIIVRRAKKVVESPPGTVTPSGKKDGPTPEQVAYSEAEREWSEKVYKWQDAVAKAWKGAITDGRLLAIAVLQLVGFFNEVQTWDSEKEVQKFLATKFGRDCVALLKSKDGPTLAEMSKVIKDTKQIRYETRFHSKAFAAMFEVMGEKMPEQPPAKDVFIGAKLKEKGFGGVTREYAKELREEGEQEAGELDVDE
jgi:ParB/RepB/Spo0J family partition protein